MFNSIQIFGMALLGGLGAGELSRRALALPRTTGYVVFGLLVGQSGLGWIAPYHIESNQLFIDLALGLILFELGYQVPPGGCQRRMEPTARGDTDLPDHGIDRSSGAPGNGLFRQFRSFRGSPLSGHFASDHDCDLQRRRRQRRQDRLAVHHGGNQWMRCLCDLATWSMPFLVEDEAIRSLAGAWTATQELGAAVVLGGACTGLVLIGARLLGRRPEHQHLLILGTIVLGVGTAIHLDISVLLPMLLFGCLTRVLDRNKQVVAIRIASDARIFLVATFVLAGAVLDIGVLMESWLEALCW
jgi:hypothetical protein